MKLSSTTANMPLIELTKRVLSSGGISARGALLLVVYYTKMILVLPGALLQNLFYKNKINSTAITKPPIFILGHYRSGTTYLHKLMAGDNRFGFITHYDIICPNTSLLFGRWLQSLLQLIINRLNIKTPFFNNSVISLSEPAEEERFLINKGSAYTDYWKFIFPLCWNKWPACAKECLDQEYFKHWSKEYESVLKLATYKNKGRQLVLKSPPNTERIKYILKMFPDAKFIYISRNPYNVFYSTRNLWNRAIKKLCLQNISAKQTEEIIFNAYSNMVDQYEKDKGLIPAQNLVEIKYEELENKPLNVLKEIYSSLNITSFSTVHQQLLIQAQKEKKYQKFEYKYDEETFSIIKKKWAKYIHQWEQEKSAILEIEYS